MKKQPFMQFFSTGDCGCSPSGSTPSIQPATVCSDAYLTLTRAFSLRMLGVIPDTKCQAFLRPAGTIEAPLAGVVWIGQDGLVFANRTPALTLPFVNPAVSGQFPATATFTTLLGSDSGGDERAWKMIPAPSAGTWLLQADGGVYRFIDAGQVPGLSSVCSSQVFATKINLTGCAQVGVGDNSEPIYAFRKLQPVDKRVVVGTIPSNGDPSGFIVLAGTDDLEHPFLKITDTARLRRIVMNDPTSGNPITDGLATTVAFGLGAITDLQSVVYSKTTKQLAFRPAPTVYQNIINASNTWTRTTSFSQIPGGHAQATSQQFHYPNVMIHGHLAFATGENVDIGLFRDGSQIQTWDYSTGNDVNVTFLDIGVTPGAHVYDFRLKGGSGGTTGNVAVRSSSIIISTQHN